MHKQMIYFVWKLGRKLVKFIDHYTLAKQATFYLDKCFDLNQSEEYLLDRRSQLVSLF